MKLYTDHAMYIGASHERSGLPCQDYALSGVFQDGAYAIVSDGCSTGGKTDVGARLIAHSIADAITHAPRILPPADYASLQRNRFNTAARVLGLKQNDLLATSAYAVVRPDGSGLVHIFGDGAMALVGTGGNIFSVRLEWANNMPIYMAYHQDGFMQFVEAHGGDLTRHVLRRTAMCISTYGRVDIEDEYISLGKALAGYTYQLPPAIESNVAFVALFTDGIGQVGALEWHEALRDLLSFKSVEGSFAKRRMNRFVRDMADLDWRAEDDISYAVIRLAHDKEAE